MTVYLIFYELATNNYGNNGIKYRKKNPLVVRSPVATFGISLLHYKKIFFLYFIFLNVFLTDSLNTNVLFSYLCIFSFWSCNVRFFLFLFFRSIILCSYNSCSFCYFTSFNMISKKNPAPTNTLAAPTFNFFMEYFSNF